MGHEKALFEAYEKMLKEEQLSSSLFAREKISITECGDFLRNPAELDLLVDGEVRYRPSETEMWEKEDVWRMFCLREDYVNSERNLLGSRTKKKLKEEEVQEIREDRERFRILIKKLRETDYLDLREGRFLKEVCDSYAFKVRMSEKRVVWEKRKMIEMLFLEYVDEKRAKGKGSEIVRIGNFFCVDEGLKKEILEGKESFEVKNARRGKKGGKKEVEKSKNKDKEEVEDKIEKLVVEKEKEKEEERVEKIVEDKKEEDDEREEEEGKNEELVEVSVLDEDGKEIERVPKKLGKMKKGDWVRTEYFFRLENSEKNEQRWKCKLCEIVLEKKKVHLLEVHRHFLECHAEIGKKLEKDRLPGDFDCRKLWLAFYEKKKCEISEELELFLNQERKRKKVKEEERDLKRRKIEEIEEEEEITGSSSTSPSSQQLKILSHFVKGKNLSAIQKKVQKALNKVILIYQYLFLLFFTFFFACRENQKNTYQGQLLLL